MVNRKLNIHIYPTPFKFESRILKEAHSIIQLGLAQKVIVLAIGEGSQPKEELLQEMISVKRFLLFFSTRKNNKVVLCLRYLEFYFRAFLWMIFQKDVAIINCHSLMV